MSHGDNRRLAKHLSNLREALFVFLERADIEATNWPAEQGIRPAVVNRKSSAGNRTDPGARTQEILTSLLRTCEQMGFNPWVVLADIFRDPNSQPYTPYWRRMIAEIASRLRRGRHSGLQVSITRGAELDLSTGSRPVNRYQADVQPCVPRRIPGLHQWTNTS